MKKILLTTVVCLSLGLVASAQEKKSKVSKVNQKAAASVSLANAPKPQPAKIDPNDELAERTAAKVKYLEAMKTAEKKGSNLSKDSKPN